MDAAIDLAARVSGATTDVAARVTSAIRDAAKATGAGFEYLLNTALRESNLNPNAKAKSSSATGWSSPKQTRETKPALQSRHARQLLSRRTRHDSNIRS